VWKAANKRLSGPRVRVRKSGEKDGVGAEKMACERAKDGDDSVECIGISMPDDIEEEEEESDDALCCVCGDGDSDEASKIVFCGGCNISVHQSMISIIPFNFLVVVLFCFMFSFLFENLVGIVAYS
jgi:hypothetical protein